ncbi:glutaredoxin [Paenibacillus sp. CC-CFT747]|nr:glutaredoxin [Paenibacillus sp. CC-CFT747]
MKLYTKTICPKCLWIKSEVQRSGLAVEIVNLDHDTAAQERLAEAGIRSVPAMEVHGQFLVDPNEMIKRMERKSG